MGLMPTVPMSRPLTLEDFEAIRDVDDGHCYAPGRLSARAASREVPCSPWRFSRPARVTSTWASSSRASRPPERPSCWVIDPDEPSLRAWDLPEVNYVLARHVMAEEVASLSLPWPLEIVPSTLVDDQG